MKCIGTDYDIFDKITNNDQKIEITRQKLFDGDQESCLRKIFDIEHQKNQIN